MHPLIRLRQKLEDWQNIVITDNTERKPFIVKPTFEQYQVTAVRLRNANRYAHHFSCEDFLKLHVNVFRTSRLATSLCTGSGQRMVDSGFLVVHTKTGKHIKSTCVL